MEKDPLILPGNLASIRPLGNYVLDVAGDVGLDQRESYQLRLAVEEIATNTVVHGYQRLQLEGELAIAACYDLERLSITVEDTAPPYDPRQTPLPEDLSRPLDQRPEGGLGVYLALMGVDDYDYERVGGRNRHTFVHFISK